MVWHQLRHSRLHGRGLSGPCSSASPRRTPRLRGCGQPPRRERDVRGDGPAGGRRGPRRGRCCLGRGPGIDDQAPRRLGLGPHAERRMLCRSRVVSARTSRPTTLRLVSAGPIAASRSKRLQLAFAPARRSFRAATCLPTSIRVGRRASASRSACDLSERLQAASGGAAVALHAGSQETRRRTLGRLIVAAASAVARSQLADVTQRCRSPCGPHACCSGI